LSFPSNRESRELSVIAAHHSLRDYAAREWPRLNHKGRLAKLCRLLPTWTDRRVRAVYNAEQGVSLRADEQEAVQRLTSIEEANRETFQDLQSRIARLEAALFQTDAEFHQPTLAALREVADVGRGGDVPRAVEPAE
jgi:hypothetical protein